MEETTELNNQNEKSKVCQFDWQQKVKKCLKSTTEFQRSIFVYRCFDRWCFI